jgi:hypothetical protein
MSAAATAAGYLYASGRLRGKGAREGGESEHTREQSGEQRGEPRRETAPAKPKRRELRVAVYAPEASPSQEQHPSVKKAPKIEYRTRRWRPE